MKPLLLAAAALAGCHASPRPVQSAEQRAQASLARWGAALELGDDAALARATDGAGQFAVFYGGTKLAASHVDGGAEAVERTTIGLFLAILLPGWFGDSWFAAVPVGSLGPALVAAGLVHPPANPAEPAFAYIPFSTPQTLERLAEASAAHRAKLREQRAWTCRLVAIEKRLAPTEPIFLRAAAISRTTFEGWLDEVDAIWLARATCASGPALFAITAKKSGDDQVLIAKLL